MEPRHPPVPYSATHANSHSSGHSSPVSADYETEYKEKDAYAHQNTTRTDRGSKSAAGRAHDSVISPFSPRASVPLSPSSSICSSAGRKHPSLSETEKTYDQQSHRLSYPPRAHLDPEKADFHASPHNHRHSAGAVVYDKSEYHESGPEDKAWQLLVCIPHMTPTSAYADCCSSTSPAHARCSPSQSPSGPSSRLQSRLRSIPCASAATAHRSPPS